VVDTGMSEIEAIRKGEIFEKSEKENQSEKFEEENNEEKYNRFYDPEVEFKRLI
jgi:glycyl-tRNA synthetase alpha subunit